MTKLYKVTTTDRKSISYLFYNSSLPKELILTYQDGEVIKAIPGTIGIACFSSLAAAESFMDHWIEEEDYLILEVEALSHPIEVYSIPRIWSYLNLTLDDLTDSFNRDLFVQSEVPYGSVFCNKIKVLGKQKKLDY